MDTVVRGSLARALAATRPAGVRDLPVVAGHLALDFANTVDGPAGQPRHDHLATYAGLLHWSVGAGILSPASAQTLYEGEPVSLRAAHALRQVVLATFGGIADGTPDADAHWAGLRPFVTDADRHADLVPAGASYSLRWPDDRPDAMLWPVARTAADLLTSPDVRRLRRCAGCPWLFLDRSRNASRRWCSTDGCGTNAKTRRYPAGRRQR